MKTGIVDVGGGMRGIYACGVMDYCMDKGIKFDVGIGVSAGAANMCAYFAEQRGRNYVFYTEYSFRKQYMSIRNFIKTGSYIDMEYVYDTLSGVGGEYPIDYETMLSGERELYVVAENALTGEPKYFTKSDMEPSSLNAVKASCSIPYVCKPYVIDGVPYYDGALGDAVPFEKALSLGCDRVVLVLSKPRDVLRDPKHDISIAKRIHKLYPASAEKLYKRAEVYNESVKRAIELEKEGRLLIIAPDDTCGVDTLAKDKKSLDALYRKGIKDAEKIPPYLN